MKTSDSARNRGFESHPLRQRNQALFWESGFFCVIKGFERQGRSAKRDGSPRAGDTWAPKAGLIGGWAAGGNPPFSARKDSVPFGAESFLMNKRIRTPFSDKKRRPSAFHLLKHYYSGSDGSAGPLYRRHIMVISSNSSVPAVKASIPSITLESVSSGDASGCLFRASIIRPVPSS